MTGSVQCTDHLFDDVPRQAFVVRIVQVVHVDQVQVDVRGQGVEELGETVLRRLVLAYKEHDSPENGLLVLCIGQRDELDSPVARQVRDAVLSECIVQQVDQELDTPRPQDVLDRHHVRLGNPHNILILRREVDVPGLVGVHECLDLTCRVTSVTQFRQHLVEQDEAELLHVPQVLCVLRSTRGREALVGVERGAQEEVLEHLRDHQGMELEEVVHALRREEVERETLLLVDLRQEVVVEGGRCFHD